MIDIKLLRQDPDLFRAGAAKKRIACDIDRLLELDQRLRESSQRADELRARQKAGGKRMAEASPAERPALLEEQRAQKAELKALDDELAPLQEELDRLLLRVPNPPAAEVPEGRDDSENVELRRVGEPRQFAFEARDHMSLAEAQGWIDVQAAGRISGSRNYFLLGDLALLEQAVMRYAFEHMVKKGFVPVSVPTLVRTEAMVGTGYFPGGEEQAYRCDDRDDLCLVGTAEVPLTALHGGSILDGARLPLKYVALSSCYRREAGTYGKDTRGLYRVHQFLKVEQVVIAAADSKASVAHHLAILENAEELLRSFDLAYRVVNVCGGDLGQGQVQKFDIETWMPSREGYGETHSASRFHDYQARRLALRYRDADGKVQFCHTLNNTVAASTRMLIALLENHQQADGTVRVPAPLVPYLGGRTHLGVPLG
ncbi:MAG: serine--tRNA ligase [Planctomycetaceae bacterium]|nr:serine--tRNA ligase [Planctomycetaceae bacterium]